MFMMRPHRLRQRGDTIVEVMVVLAVLGLALSITYATATRSLMNARQAQETAEASSILQLQVEGLRNLSAVPRPAPASKDIYIAAPFCIQNTGSAFQVVTPLPSPSTPCSGNSLYTISIIYCAVGGGSCPIGSYDTFIATATWPDVIGQGTDQVTLTYRAHQ